MSEEEFLRYLPRCDACGEVFPAGAGPNGTICVGKEWATRSGQRARGDEKTYHVECSPKRPDGSPYEPGTINYEVLP